MGVDLGESRVQRLVSHHVSNCFGFETQDKDIKGKIKAVKMFSETWQVVITAKPVG